MVKKVKTNSLTAVRFLLIGLVIAFLFLFVFLDSFASNVFNMEFYKEQYRKNEVYATFGNDGYTHQQIENITIDVFKYLKGKGEIQTDLFNDKEKDHLEDVRVVFKEGFSWYYLSVISFLILSLLLYYVSKKQKKLSHDFSIVTLTTAGLLFIALFIPAFTNFDVLFSKFHEILFEGNYLFPHNSNLIRLFPTQFFRSMTKRILLHTLAKGIAIAIVGLLPIFLKLHKKQTKMDGFHGLNFGSGKIRKK